MSATPYIFNPTLDLTFERIVDIAPEIVWKAWTTPEHLKKWFCPAPWTTSDCKIDLRPGGQFYTVGRSPEGEEMPMSCCYLEVVENKRLVWTDALGAGYRPSEKPNTCTENYFTAVITLEPHPKGTKYIVHVMHGNEEGRQKHEERGFHDGWGAALDQLVALAKKGL